MTRFHGYRQTLHALIACAAMSQAARIAAADPVLTPLPGAKDVCPDTPLRIALDAPPAPGAGRIEVLDAATGTAVARVDLSQASRTQTIGGLPNFNVHPLTVTGNELEIHLPPGALAYGAKYNVKADGIPGAAIGANWQFSTKAAPPPAGTRRLVVASDGSGDFATIQGAIDFVPAGNQIPRVIFIRSGTYNEILCVLNRDGLAFLGEDRQKTVIAYANNDRYNSNAGGNPFAPGSDPSLIDPKIGAVYHRGVFLAHRVKDLVLANLTIRNTTPRGGSQAETIILNGGPAAHALLTHVDLYSYQDTLQINGQAYINDSYIEGDVDFMWGTGPSFFENCHARALTNSAVYTTVRSPAANHGFVYQNCTLDGAPGVTAAILARIEPNRFPASEVVLLDTTMTAAVAPVGWRLTTAGNTAGLHFWEYRSHDAAGRPIDVSARLALSRQLNDTNDKNLIAQYRDAKFVLGGQWTPSLAPLIAQAPADVSAQAGAKVTLAVAAFGVPAPTYQWQKNGIALPAATQPEFTIAVAGPADAGVYSVTVSNSAGTMTAGPARVTLAGAAAP